jgi:DNA-binding MarR family transcriptional regulator
MDGPDEIIHQSLRLKIMAALRSEREGAMLEFKRLKAITGASDGNLGRQLTTLAEAGYIAISKDFAHNRPRTRAALTPAGAAAFDRHVAYLKSLLANLP